jgi:hypothetical protein
MAAARNLVIGGMAGNYLKRLALNFACLALEVGIDIRRKSSGRRPEPQRQDSATVPKTRFARL